MEEGPTTPSTPPMTHEIYWVTHRRLLTDWHFQLLEENKNWVHSKAFTQICESAAPQGGNFDSDSKETFLGTQEQVFCLMEVIKECFILLEEQPSKNMPEAPVGIPDAKHTLAPQLTFHSSLMMIHEIHFLSHEHSFLPEAKL